MSEQVPNDRTDRRPRFTLAIVAALLALLLGLALMVVAARDRPGWWPGRAAAPAPAPTPIAPPASVSATDPVTLASREAALAAQLAALEARTALLRSDAAEAGARAGRAEAILVAFAARRALDRGVGLGFLEQELHRRFDEAVPREVQLVIAAARRPVTLEDLRQSLDGAAPALLRSESDWWAGLGSELRNLVVIHRAGTPSPLPADRLARARRMLETGKVEAALAEVSRLPGAPQAEGWRAAARRYVDARRALDQLEAAAILGHVAPAA